MRWAIINFADIDDDNQKREAHTLSEAMTRLLGRESRRRENHADGKNYLGEHLSWIAANEEGYMPYYLGSYEFISLCLL